MERFHYKFSNDKCIYEIYDKQYIIAITNSDDYAIRICDKLNITDKDTISHAANQILSAKVVKLEDENKLLYKEIVSLHEELDQKKEEYNSNLFIAED